MWGLAGCASDEEPASTEGAFDNEFYFAKTGDYRVVNIAEINIFDVHEIRRVWVALEIFPLRSVYVSMWFRMGCGSAWYAMTYPQPPG